MSRGVIDRLIAKLVSNDTTDYKNLAPGIDAYKRNNVVTVYIYTTASLTTSYSKLATLPVGWRPPHTFYLPTFHAAANVNQLTSIAVDANNGNIVARIASGSSSVTVAVEFSFVLA